MLAYGFKTELLVELVNAGLATTSIDRMVAGGRRIEVTRLRITGGWPAGAGEASMALILQTLSPDRRMGALANGQQFRYHPTDPRQFDIMQSGPGWGGPSAVRSIETSRVHHAARRRGGGVAARGARAAAKFAHDLSDRVTASHRHEQQSTVVCIISCFHGHLLLF